MPLESLTTTLVVLRKAAPNVRGAEERSVPPENRFMDRPLSVIVPAYVNPIPGANLDVPPPRLEMVRPNGPPLPSASVGVAAPLKSMLATAPV